MKLSKKLKNTILRKVKLAALAGAYVMYSATAFAAVDNHALPTGGQFMKGEGSIMSANGVMNVNLANSATAAIKWDRFNVGANATVNFNGASINLLNYSTNGGMASEIYGRLKAASDANIWLVNPNGVIIGKGAQIDVGHMHLATHEIPDAQLTGWSGSSTAAPGTHTNAELMSMGNMYVNEITFDGNRVVIDADKLYTYEGDKVELGATSFDSKGNPVFNAVAGTTAPVVLGTAGNNTGEFLKASIKAANAKNQTKHAELDSVYLSIGDHAKEIVVGYTAYDADKIRTDNEKGTYAESQKWRNIYIDSTKNNRVGFAWVEDSTQLERIGESDKVLNKDFALKDGIAAVNTKEMNNGAGFKPIGADPTHGGTAFTGKFDGLGYDIYGLTINRPDEDDIGMFGHVGDGAIIRNVNLVSGSIIGNDKVGGIVGHAAVGTSGTKGITIENVKNSARVLGISNVGGIVGKAEGNASKKVDIKTAENVAFIRGNENVGGIAGSITNTNITGNTFNTGAVKGIVNYKVALGLESATGTTLLNGTKEATEKTFKIDDGYQVGSQVVYGDNTVYIKSVDDSGNATGYVKADGTAVSGTVGVGVTVVKDDTTTETKYIMDSRGSHDVGGIAGTMNISTIGNFTLDAGQYKIDDKDFQIYNDVEVDAGYNVGGIVGSMNQGTIANVANNGAVTAEAFTTDAYYYHATYVPGETVTDKNNKYYVKDIFKDRDWTTTAGNYNKKSIAVANAGGIVGVATGDGANASTIVNIAKVENYANVKSNTKAGQETINGTTYNYNYSLGGNVGGIVGKAAGGTVNESTHCVDGNSGVIISDVNNKENHIQGANNVGGIVGYSLNATIKNSVNDGGDVTATGARNKDQLERILGKPLSSTNYFTDLGFSFEANRKTSVQNNELVYYLTGNIGGVAGYMLGERAYIDNSRNRGFIHTVDKITADALYVNMAANIGGIVGKIDRKTTLGWSDTAIKTFTDSAAVAVKASANTGHVSGYSGIGGIVGEMYNGEVMTSKNLGTIQTSFAQNEYNSQANMGGILGSVPAGSSARVKIYDCFNEGIIGDPTYKTYGRHVGGLVGRLQGEVSKAYNSGDIYTASDNIGGIIGYLKVGNAYNVYNTGNITNYFTDAYRSTMKIGGVVGFIESNDSSGNVINAYNLGVLRSFIDDTVNRSHAIGGVVGAGGTAKNVYSTGEILAMYKDSSGNWIMSNAGVASISTGNATNYRVIKAEDPSKWSITDTGAYAINYADRYDIKKYTNTITGKPGTLGVYITTPTKTASVLTRPTSITDSTQLAKAFRMYCYDKNTGEELHYDVTGLDVGGVKYHYYRGSTLNASSVVADNNVVATLPMMNMYVPYVYGGSSYLYNKIGTGEDIKLLQVGTEYNPLQLNVTLNDGVSNLSIDYATSNMMRAAHIAVLNGGLEINNINNADFWLAGDYVALNGDITINGTAAKLNISSNTNFYGANVNISGTGLINQNGSVYAYNGNVNLSGTSVNNYGGITAASAIENTPVKAQKVGVSSANQSLGFNYSTTTDNQYVYSQNNQLQNKGLTVYSVAQPVATAMEGSVNVTATNGDANLYFGNNKTGKISVGKDLNVVANNIYIDSDLKVGINIGAGADPSNISLTGDTVILDLSNIGATSGNINEKERINTFVEHFSGAGKNNIVIKNAAGQSIGDNAKIIFDMYTNDVLDLEKFDYGTTKFLNKLEGINATNGASSTEKVKVFNWISDAKQLKSMQDMYAHASEENATALSERQSASSNLNTAESTVETCTQNVANELDKEYTISGTDTKLSVLKKNYEEELAKIQPILDMEYGTEGDVIGTLYYNWVSLPAGTEKDAAKTLLDIKLDTLPTLDTSTSPLSNHEYFHNINSTYTTAKGNYESHNTDYLAAEHALSTAIADRDAKKAVYDAKNLYVKETEAAMANHARILQSNFALKNSIDASELTGFESIGLTHDGAGNPIYNAYTGTFDGMGHNLNSLTPESDTSKVKGNTGLFAAIGETGVVKNLNINASRLVGTASRVGLVAGTNEGRIENVNTFGNTVRDADKEDSTPIFIGGLVGFNGITGAIVNSKSEDVVYSDSSNFQVDVGGVVGMNAGVVYNTTAKSDVSVAEGGATSLGGVAGVNVGVMKDVASLGVTAGIYDFTDGSYYFADNVGGIAGENRTVYRNAQNVNGASTATQSYTIKDDKGNVLYTFNRGGIIEDAYNDSHVKGWGKSNDNIVDGVGGVVGKNFGIGDKTQFGNLTNTVEGHVFYVANAGDVIAGENAGGLAGVNNGVIKGDDLTNEAILNAIVVKDKDGNVVTGDARKEFIEKYLKDQVIYGRNSGKITAKAGMKDHNNTANQTTGNNAGGLIGVSGKAADVANLVNGKAASVYGKTNVGGLIGENQGVLQNSKNMMENNEIAGALNVGGIVGNNSGVIVGMENVNKYNITTNKDYVYQETGILKNNITVNGETYTNANFFGGVVGWNSETGVVADSINYANVTLNTPADYVGGIIGKNDGTIAGYGYEIQNPADTSKNLDYKVQGYIRNKGAVGNIAGDYIGGLIGQNNNTIFMTDITNDITGTVKGHQYVGGIIGQNNALVTGGRDGSVFGNALQTAANGNFYKYDVYNNGAVEGVNYVGGLIGENVGSKGFAPGGTIQLAYNTGVVTGTDNYVGGIVGKNTGVVDQTFNSTGAYNAAGQPIANPGISGANYVGGLVGENTGTVSNSYNVGKVTGTSNVGNAVGKNSGTVDSVYATNNSGRLIGSNTGTIKNTVSFVGGDSTANRLATTAAAQNDTATYAGFDASKWHFQDGASTPLLTNFLTNTYFVGDATKVYNAKNQISFVGKPEEYTMGGQKVYRAKVYVADADYLTEMQGGIFDHATYVGFVYAADETGDHTIADFYNTYNLTANGQNNLMVGNTNTAGSDGKTHAGSYTLLTSNQINTNYRYDSTPDNGINAVDAANPNMLGYKFFTVKNTQTTPPQPDSIGGPVIPAGKDPATIPPLVTPTNDPFNPGVNVPTTPAPQLEITPAPLSVNLEDVYRKYGNGTITSGGYIASITGGILPGDSVNLGITNINDSIAYPNSGSRITNNVGTYDWTATGVLSGLNASDYYIPDPLVGKSHVTPAELLIQIGNTETHYGTPFDPSSYGYNVVGLVNGDSEGTVRGEINSLNGGYFNEAGAGGIHTAAGKITAPKGFYDDALHFVNKLTDLTNYKVTVLDGDATVHRTVVYVQIPNDPSKDPITNPSPNGTENVIPNNDPVIFGPDKYDPTAPNPNKPMLGPDGKYYGPGDAYQGDPNIEYIFIGQHDAELPLKVEDQYPWLQRTNSDHSWGHQEHWRERKAEVNYIIGGADFFNDLAKAEAVDYEATNEDKEVKES